MRGWRRVDRGETRGEEESVTILRGSGGFSYRCYVGSTKARHFYCTVLLAQATVQIEAHLDSVHARNNHSQGPIVSDWSSFKDTSCRILTAPTKHVDTFIKHTKHSEEHYLNSMRTPTENMMSFFALPCRGSDCRKLSASLPECHKPRLPLLYTVVVSRRQPIFSTSCTAMTTQRQSRVSANILIANDSFYGDANYRVPMYTQ